MRYAAFLRGINLGPHRKVSMAELRRLLEEAGLEDVSTYVRSGNVAFESAETDPRVLQERIKEAIASSLGMDVPVVVVTETELQAAIDRCPYREAAEADPTKVHVTFLDPMPSDDVWLPTDPEADEAYAVGDGVVYMHLPNGMARARLPGELDRATSGVTATTRNFRTVAEMASRLSA